MSRRPDMGIFDVGTCPQTSERSFKDVPDTDNTVAYVSGHSIYDPLLCFTHCFTMAVFPCLYRRIYSAVYTIHEYFYPKKPVERVDLIGKNLCLS